VRRALPEVSESREPQLLAGIVSGMRVVNGQRGRAAIFRLEDGSGSIEAVVNEELLDEQREALLEDALLVVQGRVQKDHFSGGGLRLTVGQLWDLPAARARFARHLQVAVQGSMPPLAEVIRTWPVRRIPTEQGTLLRGLAVRLRLQGRGASAEIDLGEEGLFWPCDEALARWRQVAAGGQAAVVYEAD
jgi:DNA polymerase-3 subunit alpha